MSQQWRKYSPEFRREALERLSTCTNVSALARELGIRRKWLYAWRDREKKEQNPQPAPESNREESQQIAALNKRIADLQQLAGRQAAEIDFFKGALRRIKEQRQSRGETGGTASTTKSGA